MRIDRRTLMTKAAAGAGGALFAPFTWPTRADAAPAAPGPMRVVFFLQNHGFNPGHSRPAGVTVNEKTLDKVEADIKTIKQLISADDANAQKVKQFIENPTLSSAAKTKGLNELLGGKESEITRYVCCTALHAHC